MDIRQLRYFVGIADRGSLSSAAGHLGVAQPSLSQHIMHIEEELGVQLLVRSTRGITLTESGKRLYHHAQGILGAVEAAVSDLREHGGELRGPVSFAFPSSVSNVLTVPLAETIRNDYPKVMLRAMDAMSGYVQAWLSEGAIDFGILYDVNAVRHLRSRPLLVENLFLVAAADAWSGAIGPGGIALEPVALADAIGLGLVLPHRSHGLRDMIERFADASHIRFDVALEMDSLSQIKVMVARGSAYTILAHAAVSEEIRRGELVLVPISDPAMQRTVYLVTNPARPMTRAAKAVERVAINIVVELVRKGLWLGQLIPQSQV